MRPIVSTDRPINQPVEELVSNTPTVLLAILIWRYAGQKSDAEKIQVARELSDRAELLSDNNTRDIRDCWMSVILERWRFSAYFPVLDDPAFHRCADIAWLAIMGQLP